MPAKSKFKAQDVIDAAFHIIRTQGVEKCSARAIAHEMNSSTMPIYSCINSMKELEEAIVKKAIDLLIQYETRDRTGISALDMSIGYILFAEKEKHLFRMLFVVEGGENDAESRSRWREYTFNALLERLNAFEPLDDLTHEQKKDILHKMWIFNHGLAVMLNNSLIEDLNEDDIIDLIMDTGVYVIVGVRDRDKIFSQENIENFKDIVKQRRNNTAQTK
jgi:AcrR family transcriptional regulator